MKNIHGISRAEHILRELEEAKNGGLPSGHPVVRFSSRGDEAQKLGETTKKLVDKFREAQKVVSELDSLCAEAQKEISGARFSENEGERRGYLVVSRASRFVSSVKNGIVQQLKLLGK